MSLSFHISRLLKMSWFKSKWNSSDYPVEGGRRFELPMVTCPRCGNFRGCPGVCYPFLDVEKTFSRGDVQALRTGSGRDVSWSEFKELQGKIKAVLPKDSICPPGTGFGLFYGKVFKRPAMTDFVMPDNGTLLATKVAVGRLQARGYKMSLFSPVLKQANSLEMFEIWAPPCGRSGSVSGISWCEECDRGSVSEIDSIDRDSIRHRTSEVIVLGDSPWFICVSEKLYMDISSLKLSGFEIDGGLL